MSKRLGGIKSCKYKTSSWHLNGFPDGNMLYGLIVLISVLFRPYSTIFIFIFISGGCSEGLDAFRFLKKNLATRRLMVEFYLLTFPRFPFRKKEHKSYFGKNRTHDFRTSWCAGYLLDHPGDDVFVLFFKVFGVPAWRLM